MASSQHGSSCLSLDDGTDVNCFLPPVGLNRDNDAFFVTSELDSAVMEGYRDAI
jgi:hypothetical protein